MTHKMRFKNIIISGISWAIAAAVAFFAVNLLCCFYERPTAWYDTPNGPNPSGWRPGSVLVHGTEGYGVVRVDENGYLNPAGKLQDGYVLMMGSSHTQGKEVPAEKKYSARVNAYFAEDNDTLFAYNIASDGNFLPSLIRHFPAAVQAFPDAAVITVEVASVDFSEEELENALQQVSYVAENSVGSQYRNAGTGARIKNFIKESFPMLSLIKSKLKTAAAVQTKAAGKTAEISDQQNEKQYGDIYNQAMELIRSETDCPVIFIYHPSLKLNDDGSVNVQYSKNWALFQAACSDNNISVIDMGPIFERWYYEHRQLPYGFSNTTPGSGHLNHVGHQLIANTLIGCLEEVMQ